MQCSNLASRAARWSAGHRKTAIFGWLAFVVISFVLAGAVGQKTIADEDYGNGESKAADKAIAAADFRDSADEQVLVQGKGSVKIGDAAFTAAVEDTVSRLEAVKGVDKVESPLAEGNEGQLSEGRPLRADHVRDPRRRRRHGGAASTRRSPRPPPPRRPTRRCCVGQFGDASADKAISTAFEEDFQKAEVLSLPITLLILIVAFGSLVAAGVPLLLGVTAVAATIGLLAPISQLFPMDESASSVVLLVGLAVGVDYSMFYMRRKMEERDAGRSSEQALEFAAATSGQAVLISGLTVMIAMAGMFFAGSIVFQSFAIGTILVVGIAVLGSLTVLPAVLSKLGDNVEKGRVPIIGRMRHRNHGESRVWSWILDRVLRRPVVSLVVSAGILIALAHPGAQHAHRQPRHLRAAARPRGHEGLRPHPGRVPRRPDPALVAVQADDVTKPEVQAGIEAMSKAAIATGEMSEPVTTSRSPDKTVEVVSIPMHGNGTDDTSNAALATLRDDVIPSTIGSVGGVKADVTGMTAGSKDFNDSMTSHLPIVFGFVLGLAFLLLLVTFRSIVVPIKAIVLNLLSVGAAYGILTLVFQDGHGESLLGFESFGGITSWLPLFLFVILFGLSMDYHVFILSRIREAVDRGMSTDDAVAYGIKQTAGVVTSAAVVMVAVFSIFGSLSMVEFKMMGVGLAAAVLLDATLVRGVLLPAAMKLLGEWNWYLPKRLDWLPKISHEHELPEPAQA